MQAGGPRCRVDPHQSPVTNLPRYPRPPSHLPDHPRTSPPLRLVETDRELESIRVLLRDHASRKKRLEEVCAQLDSPVPVSGPESLGTTADMEWRAQRLECLMYR